MPEPTASRSLLLELAVRDLGVLDELRLVLGPGMTAVTGETGAGKTMVVGALGLLAGGRADPGLVRPGAAEAVIEGRFARGDDETVLSRVIPAAGRSRAYIDGRAVPAAALAETAAELVDLHGQHTHVSLLTTATQRAALDAYAGVDLAPLRSARTRRDGARAVLAELGGDTTARRRAAELVRHQLDELERAGLTDPDEDERLAAEEAVLADADALRDAAVAAAAALGTDGGAGEPLATAAGWLGDRAPLARYAERVRSLAAEADDLARDLRAAAEAFEGDPRRLAEVQARRQLLTDLRRRHAGETGRPGPLAAVFERRDQLRAEADRLADDAERATRAEADLVAAEADVAREAAAVAAARREAAGRFAAEVEARLRDLALGGARFGVEVAGDDPADDVCFLLAANPGLPAAPLAKAASGGELARTMLAVRLVLSVSAPTLVFDEVDAGIGGTAARAVGRSLATLAADRQVLVVTHLPQVAAFADAQIALRKVERDGASAVEATSLDEQGRVEELSRMLSGSPTSDTAQDHAEELLVTAARERGR